MLFFRKLRREDVRAFLKGGPLVSFISMEGGRKGNRKKDSSGYQLTWLPGGASLSALI